MAFNEENFLHISLDTYNQAKEGNEKNTIESITVSVFGGGQVCLFVCVCLGGGSLSQFLRRFSKNRPIGRFFHKVAMSVCLSVCPLFMLFFLRPFIGL